MECEENETADAASGSTIKEGKAEIPVKSGSRVFYNPVQEFNRDLSVAVLTVFAREHRQTKKCKKGVKRTSNGGSKEDETDKRITVLDALSATGLRAIRFALEVPGLDEIIANDLSTQAVESIKANIKHNNVDHLVKTSLNDASLAMHLFKSERRLFDAVDLDPYGCPSRFLDSAVQVLEDGGLAMVTATDMAVLAGNTPSTCYAKYGAVSLRNSSCHEMALRIVLQCIQSHANRYGRYVVPLLSMSADFYVRLFVRIYTSPSMCKRTTSQLSLVCQCVGCKTITLLPMGEMTTRNEKDPLFTLPRLPPELTQCAHCQFSFQLGGPIWTGPLHDRTFVEKLISHVEITEFNTNKRMIGMLNLIKNELDTPLYYTVNSLCSTVHCTMIPLLDFRSALLNAGYEVSESHAAPDSIKTTAPARVVWDVIRAWVTDGHPVAVKRLESSDVARKILQAETQTRVNFSRHARAPVPTRGLLRYQVNPTAHWGPGMRATNNQEDAGASKDARRKLKQNKTKQKVEKETKEET